ncbi:uncharacterized protein METZ01_LOCUS143033 [marine metagenome]|uniref:Uncharacterized protein n=1 Tax=marine metagenome TaxID=408172 RepID=A0A381ZLV9_9ZZZZ
MLRRSGKRGFSGFLLFALKRLELSSDNLHAVKPEGNDDAGEAAEKLQAKQAGFELAGLVACAEEHRDEEGDE